MRVHLEFEADSLEELFEFLGEKVISNAFRDGKIKECCPYQQYEDVLFKRLNKRGMRSTEW